MLIFHTTLVVNHQYRIHACKTKCQTQQRNLKLETWTRKGVRLRQRHVSPPFADFSIVFGNVSRSHFLFTVRALLPFSHVLFYPHHLATAFLRELSVIQEVRLLLVGLAAFVTTERLQNFWHFVHLFPVYGEATFGSAFLPDPTTQNTQPQCNAVWLSYPCATISGSRALIW